MIELKLPELMTVKEAAKYMHVSTKTVIRWIEAGLLDYIRIGKEYRILKNSLLKCSV